MIQPGFVCSVPPLARPSAESGDHPGRKGGVTGGGQIWISKRLRGHPIHALCSPAHEMLVNMTRAGRLSHLLTYPSCCQWRDRSLCVPLRCFGVLTRQEKVSLARPRPKPASGLIKDCRRWFCWAKPRGRHSIKKDRVRTRHRRFRAGEVPRGAACCGGNEPWQPRIRIRNSGSWSPAAAPCMICGVEYGVVLVQYKWPIPSSPHVWPGHGPGGPEALGNLKMTPLAPVNIEP